ncbi:DUF3596 domain-containing protein [Nitrogeniibacter mangrovi]|uniref:DUF3596 domain-containing protein n=1 Tax=Nitrogeniibacter mangrovi TaxID=2016596 RepID=A0A6C1B1V6_9RHOO|nr:DUF3596 domain-containing protein [Nitrogeniibacter mangrovi]QID17343.1 DUF3596 domain-containing protein [Nitrogeniibacter mangrovi]
MGSIRKRADNGKLFLDFRYRGKRCREQTDLDDTSANRKRLNVNCPGNRGGSNS